MRPIRFDEPYRLGSKTIYGRFVIPSGIRATHASNIHKCFREIPSIGMVTTKSISAAPRAGYREPIYARYAPGCYINAVGLANPGAEAFFKEFEGLSTPPDKFLLVSLMGSDVESFLEAARTLLPLADGFELNMSCPHAKGYGVEVGQDENLLFEITRAVAHLSSKPVFVKMSPMLPNLGENCRIAVDAGATGLTLINTAGPAMAAHGDDPILSNRYGGLSGDGIRPLGLRAVEQARKAVGDEPWIIGMGGIASPEHVRQYAAAGADLFGVGSALTGLDSAQMRAFFERFQSDLCAGGGERYERSCETTVPMDYTRVRIAARVDYDETLFKMILDRLPGDPADGDLAGKFYFLWGPGAGEKPFAVFSAAEKSIVIRSVGCFTRYLAGLTVGAELYLRGPYGAGFPDITGSTVVLVGGGTGIASVLEIAHKLRRSNRLAFLLGARTAKHLFDVERFGELGPVYLATDDGTLGRRGFVPSLLSEMVENLPPDQRARLVFINCGPEPMVRRCFELQRAWTAPERIYGSIEYMTSCGVGICGKCASPSGALTCIDGPFLPLREFERP